MNSIRKLKPNIWIADPTEDDLKIVRSIVNVRSVSSAWIHTGEEMQLEPCHFRLVLEIDSTNSGSALIISEVKQKALREGLLVYIWCIPAGQVEQFYWLLENSVRVN